LYIIIDNCTKTDKIMKELIIFPGNFAEFRMGQKAPGLHLNRFVRDILRECGYPCVNCGEACAEPDLCETISACLGSGNFSGEFGDLLNVPQIFQDLELLGPGAKGDLIYFDGFNWVSLPVGTNGEILTLTAGEPTWAAGGGGGGGGGGGASTYLGLTDTPGTFGFDDIVPTTNTGSTALVHETNNRLHVETGTYGVIGASSFVNAGNPVISTFVLIPSGITVTGDKMINTYSGTASLAGTGTFPGILKFEMTVDNTGKKYPIANPIYNTHISVNGVMVDAPIVGGTATTVIYGVPVTLSTDTIAFRGSIIGTV
jgi:hypothetical protein